MKEDKTELESLGVVEKSYKLVSQDRAKLGKQVNQDRDIGQLIKRLDMLDERLDNSRTP